MKLLKLMIIGLLLFCSNAYAISFSIFTQDGVVNDSRSSVSWGADATVSSHPFNEFFQGLITLDISNVTSDLYSASRITFDLINDTDKNVSIVDSFYFYGDYAEAKGLTTATNQFSLDSFTSFNDFTGGGLSLGFPALEYFSQKRDYNYQHAVAVSGPMTDVLLGLGILSMMLLTTTRKKMEYRRDNV